MAGLFITFEGSEGVGKTTCINYFAELLKSAGLDLLLTREPGGTELGEAIRDVLLQPRPAPVSAMTELLLMFSARAQHIEEVIQPALEAGRCVLCDRFTDASFAYQGGGRGIDHKEIEKLEVMVQGDLRPDMTVLLDADIATGMARAKGRGELDRIEQEALAFFERVRQSYLARSQEHASRFRVVDANKPLNHVQAELLALASTITGEIVP